MNPTLAARNDGIVHLALKKAGQLFCRKHEDVIVRQVRGIAPHETHILRVICRHCLRESQGFVVGDEPETRKDARLGVRALVKRPATASTNEDK